MAAVPITLIFPASEEIAPLHFRFRLEDRVFQKVLVKLGLHKILAHIVADGFLHEPEFLKTGQDDENRVRVISTALPQQFKPVHHRHLDVSDYYIGGRCGKSDVGFFSVSVRAFYGAPDILPVKQMCYTGENNGLVIHNHDFVHYCPSFSRNIRTTAFVYTPFSDS